MKAAGSSVKLKLTLKRAKKLQLAILNARGAEAKKPYYCVLVVAAGDVFKQLPAMLKECRRLCDSGIEIEKSIAEIIA